MPKYLIQTQSLTSRWGFLYFKKCGEVMAKSKADYWLTDDGLILLEGWSRDGLTLEQIAHNMGVSLTTLKSYRQMYPTILTALKKGKEVVDFQVENALLKRALGGDTTAQIFWLKNRKSRRWRDRPEEDTAIEAVNIVDDL